jgi:anti-anti-sigma factor
MATVRQQDGVTIVEMDESYNALDEGPIDALSELLMSQIEKASGTPRLVLDFTRTNYISSRVLEVLFRTWKRVKERNGQFVLCGVQPFCGEVLQITHLDRIWDMHSDSQAAVAAVKA